MALLVQVGGFSRGLKPGGNFGLYQERQVHSDKSHDAPDKLNLDMPGQMCM